MLFPIMTSSWPKIFGAAQGYLEQPETRKTKREHVGPKQYVFHEKQVLEKTDRGVQRI